ncbi:MAG TPA: cysteine rich repeat-containing protein [Xanthobacteraceae bacterium]|nr:cysteine rich repeat-containing protein [Xanthobacteraceae bacterium]
MGRPLIARLLAVLVLAAGFSSVALAQSAEQRAACGDDFKKLCNGVIPGGGRVLDCLARQKDKLSDACRKVVESQGR